MQWIVPAARQGRYLCARVPVFVAGTNDKITLWTYVGRRNVNINSLCVETAKPQYSSVHVHNK